MDTRVEEYVKNSVMAINDESNVHRNECSDDSIVGSSDDISYKSSDDTIEVSNDDTSDEYRMNPVAATKWIQQSHQRWIHYYNLCQDGFNGFFV